MSYRVGIGYDTHRLIEGRKLFLGGIQIPYIRGLLGHSDADVLLHAICDSLLGAAALGDIGEHFPDTDPKYLNASSLELLKKVKGMLLEKGYLIRNLDTVIIAGEPQLSPFKAKMQERIASALGIETGCVGIKAKTNEGLGELGKKEAIAAYAVALLQKTEVKCTP